MRRGAFRTACRPPSSESGGKLYDPRCGSRMRGEGIFAEQVKAVFETAKRRYGLDQRDYELSAESFRRPGEVVQLGLFG